MVDALDSKSSVPWNVWVRVPPPAPSPRPPWPKNRPLTILSGPLATVAVSRLVRRTATPHLLPHLRAVDADQDGHAQTLGLSGISSRRAKPCRRPGGPGRGSRLARAYRRPLLPARRRAHGPALKGYAEALVRSRMAILALLQGEEPRRSWPPPAPGGILRAARAPATWARSGPWCEEQSSWLARGILLHLVVHRARPLPHAVGRLSRLLMNTLVSAAGHSWVSHPRRCAGCTTPPFAPP